MWFTGKSLVGMVLLSLHKDIEDREGGNNMAKRALKPDYLNEILQTTSRLTKFPTKRFYVDYDEEADVLYLSFERPQNATDSQMLNNSVLLRYREEDLVGVTILDASKR